MAKIDHYMVDYVDNGGNVAFANDTPIHSLTVAKAIASKFSRSHDTGAVRGRFHQRGRRRGPVRSLRTYQLFRRQVGRH